MRIFKVFFKIIFILFPVLYSWSQSADLPNPQAKILNSLQEIEAYARDNNLDYRKAQLAATRAAEAMEDIFKFNKSSLSLSGQYGKIGDPDFLEASASLSVPIIDQLSISARIYGDLDYQEGLSLNPLYHSDSRTQLSLNYQKTRISLSNLGMSAGIEAQRAALSLMINQRKVEYQEKYEDLMQISYQDERVK